MEVVADLLGEMDAVTDAAGGTLLDNSLVMFASDMHHGDHACFDLPLALFGSGSGIFVKTNSCPYRNRLKTFASCATCTSRC